MDRGIPTLPAPLILARDFQGRLQKEEERMRDACAVHRQGGYTATWRVNDATGPGQSPAQDVFF